MHFPLFFSVLTAALTSACATPEVAKNTPETAVEAHCEEPRPQICTMIYAPVCAARSDGANETYASQCNACADDSVQSYVDGPCAEAVRS